MKKENFYIIIGLVIFIAFILIINDKADDGIELKKDKVEEKQETITISTDYKNIDKFLNSIFEELKYTNEMKYAILFEQDDYILYPFISKDEKK